MKTFLFLAFVFLLAPKVPAQKYTSSSRLPLTVEVQKDVEVTHETVGGQEKGKLYLGGPLSSKDFVIKKGQRFQMTAVHQEGGCRIRFENRQYDISSCPWLEGFTDHQAGVFRVIEER